MIYFEIILLLTANIISVVLLLRGNNRDNIFKKEVEEIKKNIKEGE